MPDEAEDATASEASEADDEAKELKARLERTLKELSASKKELSLREQLHNLQQQLAEEHSTSASKSKARPSRMGTKRLRKRPAIPEAPKPRVATAPHATECV